MSDPITFIASVYKVQTLVDNGVRVTLDLPENCIMQMAQLAECKRAGVALDIEAKPKYLTKLDDETKKDTKGIGIKVGRRRSTNRRDKR